MSEAYAFVGSLNNGEAIYRSESGMIAIEKDHRYLVTATPEELEELLKRFPKEAPKPTAPSPSACALSLLKMALFRAK